MATSRCQGNGWELVPSFERIQSATSCSAQATAFVEIRQ
jgi:hypothetical protein